MPPPASRATNDQEICVARSARVKSSCLQIFGRKIRKLIKFNSLITKHLNERLISISDTGRLVLQRDMIDGWNVACTHEHCLFKQDVLHLQRGGRIQISEDCRRSWISWKPTLERANQLISPRATSSQVLAALP